MATEIIQRDAAPSAAAKLRGVQKAAVLLVAIGEQRAGEIFKYLGESEVEALSLELAKAQKVPTEVCRDVITEAGESVLAGAPVDMHPLAGLRLVSNSQHAPLSR